MTSEPSVSYYILIINIILECFKQTHACGDLSKSNLKHIRTHTILGHSGLPVGGGWISMSS